MTLRSGATGAKRNHSSLETSTLMVVTIKVRKDGPYAVDLATGSIDLVDADGNAIPLPQLPPGKTTIVLCRCGGSSKKPFCDGTHSKVGFKGAEQAAREFDTTRQSGQSGPAAGP